jgi:hypothetical protein
MVQLSTTRGSCIAILWVSLVSTAITLCVASQRVFVVYFVVDLVRKLLERPSYFHSTVLWNKPSYCVLTSESHSLLVPSLLHVCSFAVFLITFLWWEVSSLAAASSYIFLYTEISTRLRQNTTDKNDETMTHYGKSELALLDKINKTNVKFCNPS